MPTVAELVYAAAHDLARAAGDDARLEAEVLLAHAMRIDRTHVLARLHEPAPDAAARAFEAMLARRVAREPLSYIVGRCEFYAIDIECAPGALIPRPETEMLVDFALEEIARRSAEVRVIDIGTGTAAIAVAIAVKAPRARVVAIDASGAALDIARRNVERHGVSDRVDLRRADLLDVRDRCDIIVANLPYVSEADWSELQPEIRDHEPREALVGGAQGTEIIERMLAEAPARLAPGGVLAAEIGETQAARLLDVTAEFFRDADACVMKDFAGKDRMLVVRT